MPDILHLFGKKPSSTSGFFFVLIKERRRPMVLPAAGLQLGGS
jgi:hypothetical protein